ncbi:hypothetical protein ABIA33_005643 [Streptacidiphilus sp. MAP12-16]|uniref:hypothetical protein n=1 Tax=Streptacidiphilus sp. MAP12-16 TaxID=3156300 RepID=UPI0035131F0C
MDTRTSLGWHDGGLSSGQSIALTGLEDWYDGVPPFGATALTLNVTATNTATGGYVAVFPYGPSDPNTSTLDFSAGPSPIRRWCDCSTTESRSPMEGDMSTS